jgi:hypothetical protein
VVLNDPSSDSEDILRRNRSHERRFAFDHVLDATASQQDVYRCTARPLLKSFVGPCRSTHPPARPRALTLIRFARVALHGQR